MRLKEEVDDLRKQLSLLQKEKDSEIRWVFLGFARQAFWRLSQCVVIF